MKQSNEKKQKTEIQKQPDQEISEDDNTSLVAENEQEE